LSGASTLGDSVTLYTGFIAIRAPGTYQFDLNSDDGSALSIGGTNVIDDDGLHALKDVSASVSFLGAGLYSFSVDQFENGGWTGVTVLENGARYLRSVRFGPRTRLDGPARCCSVRCRAGPPPPRLTTAADQP
jgi:hypothetical protein